MTWTRRDTQAVLVPLALALLVFARALAFPFVAWDDPSHFLQSPLAEHPLARGLGGLFWTREIGYPAPVLLLSFALDRVLFDLSPGPYHAENLAFHLANVGLLFWIARRIGLRTWEACGAVTLFAIHPLVAEPVSWVTGRKDMLATFLLFSATLIAAGPRERETFSPAPRWVVANLLAMISVLVLPRSVVAPVLIVLLVTRMRPTWPPRRVALAMAPALPFAFVVIRLGTRQLQELGAIAPPRTFGALVQDVAGAWALQLSHVVWPFDLLSYYFRVPGDPSVVAMVVAAIVGLAAAVYVLRHREPEDAPMRTGFLLAAVAYAPVSCFVRIVRWTSDSYMYLPLAGIGIAVAALVGRVWPRRLALVGAVAGAALALVFSIVAFVTAGRYRSSTELSVGAIARYPTEALAYEHEALGLMWDGRVDEANVLFRELAVRFPDWDDAFDDEFRAYAAIGDEAHAQAVLARGVRARSAACLRIFWTRALAGVDPAPDPALLGEAFRGGFDAMKGGLHQPAQWTRIAAMLRAAGLKDDAARAEEQAAFLASGAPGP